MCKESAKKYKSYRLCGTHRICHIGCKKRSDQYKCGKCLASLLRLPEYTSGVMNDLHLHNKLQAAFNQGPGSPLCVVCEGIDKWGVGSTLGALLQAGHNPEINGMSLDRLVGQDVATKCQEYVIAANSHQEIAGPPNTLQAATHQALQTFSAATQHGQQVICGVTTRAEGHIAGVTSDAIEMIRAETQNAKQEVVNFTRGAESHLQRVTVEGQSHLQRVTEAINSQQESGASQMHNEDLHTQMPVESVEMDVDVHQTEDQGTESQLPQVQVAVDSVKEDVNGPENEDQHMAVPPSDREYRRAKRQNHHALQGDDDMED